jgi:hypothetical protein
MKGTMRTIILCLERLDIGVRVRLRFDVFVTTVQYGVLSFPSMQSMLRNRGQSRAPFEAPRKAVLHLWRYVRSLLVNDLIKSREGKGSTLHIARLSREI